MCLISTKVTDLLGHIVAQTVSITMNLIKLTL